METPVGDRNVLVALDEHDLVLGGEQSGHVIFRELATTGDGVLTGLARVRSRASRRADRCRSTRRDDAVPAGARQRSGRARRRTSTGDRRSRAEIAAVETELGDEGRVLVRASGTEPVVRVMVEAATEPEAEAAVARLRRAVETAFAS